MEWLAMPPTGAPPIGLDPWLSAFKENGQPVAVTKDDGETWIEISALRLRGFVSFDGEEVEAINFELNDPSQLSFLETVAEVLGWELYSDDGEEDDD